MIIDRSDGRDEIRKNTTFDFGAANQTQLSKIELESASEADCGI